MVKKSYNKTFKGIAGYTIDQTILIVAVIAILITMIIASVGWDLLSRAGGTKLASHLRQFETGVGQFFAKHSVWPHQAGGSTGLGQGAANFRALITRDVIDAQYQPQFENYLPSYDGTQNPVQHGFGGGGDVTLDVEELNGQDYLTFTLIGVPKKEYEETDKRIDGEVDYEAGRIQGVDNGTTVDMKYYANIIN
jgi:NADH:ubiquinone oxidoreductase subunit 3 (subunit A)